MRTNTIITDWNGRIWWNNGERRGIFGALGMAFIVIGNDDNTEVHPLPLVTLTYN